MLLSNFLVAVNVLWGADEFGVYCSWHTGNLQQRWTSLKLMNLYYCMISTLPACESHSTSLVLLENDHTYIDRRSTDSPVMRSVLHIWCLPWLARLASLYDPNYLHCILVVGFSIVGYTSYVKNHICPEICNLKEPVSTVAVSSWMEAL